MTDIPTTDQRLGEALGRINRAVRRVHEVTTDGSGYNPRSLSETIAADLGFARPRRDMANRTPTIDELYPAFVRDAGRAERKLRWNRRAALRVLIKAGAAPEDVALVREALGIEEQDESGWDHIDELNEQTRRHWQERAATQFAYAVANAHEEGRRSALSDLQVIASSGLLEKRGSDMLGLSADVRGDAEAVKDRGVTALDNVLANAKDGTKLTVRGTLTSVSKRSTAQGGEYASAVLADGATVHLEIMPNVYERVGRRLVEGARVEASGDYRSWACLPTLMVKDLTIVGALVEEPAA